MPRPSPLPGGKAEADTADDYEIGNQKNSVASEMRSLIFYLKGIRGKSP